MTDRERYKRAFSTLHASDKIFLEVEIMEKNKKTYLMKKTLAACAAAAVIFGSMTAAYAADLGGIQEKITVWLHGEETEVNVTGNGRGGYTYTYTDEDGSSQEIGGGGVAIDDNGNEVPLSAEDVMSTISNEVVVREDGSIWLYYFDKQIDITDLFDENGICKVAVEYDGDMAYFTIQGNGSGEYGFQMTMERPENAEQFTQKEYTRER